MEDLVPMVVVSVIFGTLVLIIKIISDNRIRTKLIESGQVDEKAKFLYLRGDRRPADPLSSVKWGMVLVGVGLALIIGQFVNQFMYFGDVEGITFGLMCLFAGIAFLIYYNLKKKENKEPEEPAVD